MTDERWNEILERAEQATKNCQKLADSGSEQLARVATVDAILILGTAVLTLATIIRDGQKGAW